MPILQATDDRDLGLALSNPTLGEVTVTLTARNYDGTIITGEGIRNPLDLALPALGQRAFRSVELFGEGFVGQTGWVEVVTPTTAVKGFFLVFDSALTYIDGADLTTAASTRLVFPKVSATSESSTEISFVNIGSQRLPSVQVQLYENDGRLRAGTVLDVGAYSGFSGNITQLVPEATDFEGYAVIESDLAGGSGSETLVGFETYRNISDVAALNAMGAGAELRTGYLAHLASRGGYTPDWGS